MTGPSTTQAAPGGPVRAAFRLLGSFLGRAGVMIAGFLGATLLVAPLQALAIGAADRGPVATSLTLTVFFGASLAPFLVVAALVSMPLEALLRRLRLPGAPSAFLAGSLSVALVLVPTPFGDDPLDTVGFVVAWVLAGGVGPLALEAARTGRRGLVTFFVGVPLAALCGALAIFIQRALEG